MFRTDYLLKVTNDEINKYDRINNNTIIITDKKLTYALIKENFELKQQLLIKKKQITELEKELF